MRSCDLGWCRMPMDWGPARDYAARDVHAEEMAVTEAEWLVSTDPLLVLKCLDDGACRRRVPLFVATCCRYVWHLLPDRRSQRAVDALELYADAKLSRARLRETSNDAYRAWQATAYVDPEGPGEPPDKDLYGSALRWRRQRYEQDPMARLSLAPHRLRALFHAARAVWMASMLAPEVASVRSLVLARTIEDLQDVAGRWTWCWEKLRSTGARCKKAVAAVGSPAYWR